MGQNLTTDEIVTHPTTHDITPRFVGKSLTVINNLLADGNKVLIVTKPQLSVVQRLCRELQQKKHLVRFRFTIGALDPELCAFWEPPTPSPLERAKALRHAFAQESATSVSIEPMLGSVDESIKLVGQLEPFVTDTLWIGKMQRVPMKLNSHVPGFVAARELIRMR